MKHYCAALFTSSEDKCRTSGPHTLQWLSLASDHSSDDNQPCMLRRVLRPMLYFFVETTEKSFKAKQSKVLWSSNINYFKLLPQESANPEELYGKYYFQLISSICQYNVNSPLNDQKCNYLKIIYAICDGI